MIGLPREGNYFAIRGFALHLTKEQGDGLTSTFASIWTEQLILGGQTGRFCCWERPRCDLKTIIVDPPPVAS